MNNPEFPPSFKPETQNDLELRKQMKAKLEELTDEFPQLNKDIGNIDKDREEIFQTGVLFIRELLDQSDVRDTLSEEGVNIPELRSHI
ncbi:MAG: hypothetical protein ABEJ24_02800 [Candidatus Magasanikbacteria bacterium]